MRHGKLAWYHQPSPHDTHDWDNVETPVLFDGVFRRAAAQIAGSGRAQRDLLRAGPNQWEEPGDQGLRRREWMKGRRREGTAHSRPGEGAKVDGTLINTPGGGGNELASAEFQPDTGLF